MKPSEHGELLGLGAIPLEETVQLLHGLVREMLRQAESGQALDVYSAWKAMPDHTALLAAIDDFSLKAPRNSVDALPTDVVRKLTQKLFRLWRGRDLSQSKFKGSMRRQIEHGFDDRRWQCQLQRRLGTAVQGPYHKRRDLIWALAGPFAWSDTVFQSEISFWAVQRLRESYWGVGGNWSPPLFHPLTYWALITCGKTPRFHLAARCLRSLRAHALMQALATDGWAGFWEQWLLRQAIGCTPNVPVVLMALPWRRPLRMPPEKQVAIIERQSSVEWRNQIPTFVTGQHEVGT